MSNNWKPEQFTRDRSKRSPLRSDVRHRSVDRKVLRSEESLYTYDDTSFYPVGGRRLIAELIGEVIRSIFDVSADTVIDDIESDVKPTVVRVTTGDVDRNITLPLTEGNVGREIFIQKADVGSGHVRVLPTSPDTINGEVEYLIRRPGEMVGFLAAEGNWIPEQLGYVTHEEATEGYDVGDGISSPTTPTNVTAVAHHRNVVIRWNANPLMTAKREFIVERSDDELGTYAVVAEVRAEVFQDTGLALAGTSTNPLPRTYWYRVSEKALSGPHVDDISDASDPVDATVSGIDVEDYVAGSITREKIADSAIDESKLSSPLADRIDLVDGSGAGSVNARLSTLDGEIQAEIDAINAVLADIEGIAEYNSEGSYAEGDVVKYDGALWKALQSMSDPVPVPSEGAYWTKIGDYSSLSEAVAAHAVMLSDHDTRIDAAEGTLSATVTDVQALDAAVFDEESGLSSKASLTQVNVAIADYDAEVAGGMVATVTGLNTTVGEHSATLTVQGESIDGVVANYFIKADVDGNISGFGLFAEGAESQFHVLASEFSVALGSERLVPFVIKVVNGTPTLWFDGRISARTLSVLARELVNNPSVSGHIHGYGGVLEDGTGSSTHASYHAGNKAMAIQNAQSASVRSQSFAIDHGKIYRVSAKIRKDTALGGQYMGISAFAQARASTEFTNGNAQGTQLVGSYGASRTLADTTANVYFAGTSTTAWTTEVEIVGYVIGAYRDVADCPQHKYAIRPFLKLSESTTEVALRFLNWNNGSGTPTVYVRDISVVEVGQGQIVAENIVAGAIVAEKIATGAVTADKIEAGAVTADKVSVGALTADRISDLGALATEDMVELARLGATVIDGGYLRTDLLDVGTILGEDATFRGTLEAATGLFRGYVQAFSVIDLNQGFSFEADRFNPGFFEG